MIGGRTVMTVVAAAYQRLSGAILQPVPGMRRMWPAAAIMVAAVTLASVTAGVAAASPTVAITLGRIAGQRVRPGYGETVRLGQAVVVSGTVTHPPAHARIQLQGRTTAAWHALLSMSFRGENFTLLWHVRVREFQLRAVLFSGRHRIAASAVASLLVGSAIVRCRPAAAPADLPAGDGWIEGGVYLQGGPAPGIDQCQSGSSTVIASSVSGSVVASQNLAGGDGYALVVAAGTYQLRDGECVGEATVSAGRRTVADTDCDFP
jgi:hypothetical protein